MKLISCHITAFGKFVNQAFDLSKDIVEIKQDNGWGKTTLITFIESMLFGMSASRGKQVADDIRQKYQPFQGGGYGGSLTFSYRNETYRIERTFGKTPAMDTVKLYDKNNLPAYVFGESIENLGELIFGINKESYHRTAYIAHGEMTAQGLPEDTKARLIALLSVENDKQNGAQSALQRLEQAESKLRGKRAPKNGLLDQIDARLNALEIEKRECAQAAIDVYSAQKRLEALSKTLEQTQGDLQKFSTLRDEQMQNSTRVATQMQRQDLQRRIARSEDKLAKMQAFFGQNNPLTVNVEGIESAVKEYYALQAWFDEQQSQSYEQVRKEEEHKGLLEAYHTCQKELQTFEQMLDEQHKQARKAFKDVQREANASEQKQKIGTVKLLLALIATLIGATQIESLPIIGWPLVGLGGGFIAWTFLETVFSTKFWKYPFKRKKFKDKKLNRRYREVQREFDKLQEQLGISALENEHVALFMQKREENGKRAEELKLAIENFLSNFAFAETYDYRAALSVLKEKCEAYNEEYQERELAVSAAAQLPAGTSEDPETLSADMYAMADVEELKKRIGGLESDERNLFIQIANAKASVASLEQKAYALADYKAEEAQLLSEKARLERKLSALQTAKTLLERARENMAARYLQPVETISAQLLKEMKTDFSATLKFTADGTPLLDDNGVLRPLAYYSQGTQELIGFCMRWALIEAVYAGETPILLFDDPFVHLDDTTTSIAKRVVQKLAKKYQIIYCTCKEERRIK